MLFPYPRRYGSANVQYHNIDFKNSPTTSMGYSTCSSPIPTTVLQQWYFRVLFPEVSIPDVRKYFRKYFRTSVRE